MKEGSVVCLARPYRHDSAYQNAFGIIIRIYRPYDTSDVVCVVRFPLVDDPSIHEPREIMQHRLDVVKE